MAETQITDDAPNLDQKPDLGKILAHFSVEQRGLKRWTLLIFGTIFTIGSLLAIIYLGFTANTAVQRHGRAALLGYLPMPFAPLVLLFLLGGVFIFLAWLYWHNGITLYEKGIRHQKSRQIRIWYWEDIVRLDTRVIHVRFSGSTIASHCRVIMEDQHKHQWIIRNHHEQMAQLIARIREQVLPVIYQRMVHRLIEGEAIVFSKNLQAIRNGLKINDSFSPWTVLEDPEIRNATFLLKRRDTQEMLYKTHVDQMTNLDSLIHLINNPPPTTDQPSPR